MSIDNDFLIVILHSYINFAACLDPPLGCALFIRENLGGYCYHGNVTDQQNLTRSTKFDQFDPTKDLLIACDHCTMYVNILSTDATESNYGLLTDSSMIDYELITDSSMIGTTCIWSDVQ